MVWSFYSSFPAKIGVQGAIFRNTVPAPRTPQNMLLMKCTATASGQASRGTASGNPHFGRHFACFLAPHPGHPPAHAEYAELLKGVQAKVPHAQKLLVAVGH
eukprot:1141337-Pelagomonas_calceolata.AAC.3